MSLSEIVSGIGLTFFPIAALLLFLAVFATVLVRTFLKYDRAGASHMSAMVFDDDHSTPEAEGAR